MDKDDHDSIFLLDLVRRPRRLRRTEAIRSLTQEHWVRVEDLVQPLFVIEGNGPAQAIDSMPGIMRFPLPSLLRECERLSNLDIRAIALFPALIDANKKNALGTEALNAEGLIPTAVKAIKEHVPELMVITDIALDPFTTHGHDGILNEKGTDLDNDATVEILSEMAAIHAAAGVDFVAPSDMMDGRVAAIRDALDSIGFTETAILAYTAKYNSAFYGPFRSAVGSVANANMGSTLSKKTYQLNPANVREALLEAQLDESEGADILMVKPAGLYLDIIAKMRENTQLPIAAYQVSGEYAMLQCAIERGYFKRNRAILESLLSIKRAGADIIFSYFAAEFAESLQQTIN